MCTTKFKIPTVEDVRKSMQRVLSAEERQTYRGITIMGMTGTMFDRLFNVETAEDLILAETGAAQRIPADDPENVYHFSPGRGLVARYDPIYVNLRMKASGDRKWIVCEETISELDAKFRALPLPYAQVEEKKEAEEILNDVAATYIAWASKQFNWGNS